MNVDTGPSIEMPRDNVGFPGLSSGSGYYQEIIASGTTSPGS